MQKWKTGIVPCTHVIFCQSVLLSICFCIFFYSSLSTQKPIICVFLYTLYTINSGTIEGGIAMLNSKNLQVHSVIKKAHLGILTSLVFSHDSRLSSVFLFTVSFPIFLRAIILKTDRIKQCWLILCNEGISWANKKIIQSAGITFTFWQLQF
jgi:hypothetical protein